MGHLFEGQRKSAQLKYDREGCLRRYGATALVSRNKFRLLHDDSGSLFVESGTSSTEDLGVTDIAIFIHDELHNDTAFNVGLWGELRVLNLGLESTNTTNQLWHLFDDFIIVLLL